MLFVGRNIFYCILESNFNFIDEIFGLLLEVVCNVVKVLSGNNFDFVFDIYMRSNVERILLEGYVINCDKWRNCEFRMLISFVVGGLFYYVGLI